MKYLVTILSLFLILATCCKKVDAVPYYALTLPQSDSAPEFQVKDTVMVPEEVLVKFRNGVVDNVALAKAKGQIKKRSRTKAMIRKGDPGYHVIKVPNIANAVAQLKLSNNVLWATPNYLMKRQGEYTNDTYTLWGMGNINADVTYLAGNKGNQTIYVGVIDEGIHHWHEDLCGQIWTNPFDSEDGVDNDGNGYIDDIKGWDFRNKDNSVFDQRDNHGTHVSGTIGGLADNNKGVYGVAPHVKIISAKFLEGSGSLDDAVAAIDYLTDLKVRHGLNIVATNNSWGGFSTDGTNHPALEEAILRANDANILFIAAAGNNGYDNDGVGKFMPASSTAPNVISVAAITSVEALASFSNWGDTTVDIGAPGAGITSTVGDNPQFGNVYGTYNGTSMATPHVTGAAVLYKAKNPSATAAQIKTAILATARSIPALTGKTVTGGTLDVSSLIGYTSPAFVQGPCAPAAIDTIPPTAPTNLRPLGAISPTSYRVKWDLSTDNIGLDYYYLTIRDSIQRTVMNWILNGTENMLYGEAILPDLVYGKTYSFVVRARDKGANWSEESNSIFVNTNPDFDNAPPPSWYTYTLRYDSLNNNGGVCNEGGGVVGTYYSISPTLGLSVYLNNSPNLGDPAKKGFYSDGIRFYYIPRTIDREVGAIGWLDSCYTGTTPPPPPDSIVWHTYSLKYSVDSAYGACMAASNNYFSTSATLGNGIYLYVDSVGGPAVPAGYYSNGTLVWNSSNGQLTTNVTCSSVTPPPPPPPPVGTISVTAAGSYTSTKLHVVSWNIAVSGGTTITKAEVYFRKGTSGTWFLQTTDQSGNAAGTWTNPTKQRPGKYQYYVKAYGSGGLISNSNVIALNGTNK